MFLPEELQVLLQGYTTFDWHLLEKVLYTRTCITDGQKLKELSLS